MRRDTTTHGHPRDVAAWMVTRDARRVNIVGRTGETGVGKPGSESPLLTHSRVASVIGGRPEQEITRSFHARRCQRRELLGIGQ